MFKKIFGGGKKKQEQKKNTIQTVDTQDKISPRQQRQQYLLKQSLLQKELTFKILQKNDNYRSPIAHNDGGFICDDPKQVDKIRSVGKQMLKLIGKKLLSGQFNLTRISFPIRSCYPKSALYNSVAACNNFPYFMSNAAKQENPLERFKLVLTCLLSTPYYLNMFLKPFNPILGETLQGTLIDGTQIYAQQISHHPPVSYFLIVGPNDSYKYSGYYDFDASPRLNSMTLKNKGKRRVQFKDGTVIQANYPTNQYSSAFMGTLKIEQLGACEFRDIKNEFYCKVEFGKLKKKPSDYFQTVIQNKQKQVSKVFGTYCGFIQFDGLRYWDGRDFQAFHIELKKTVDLLPSDWSFRQDIIQFWKNQENLDNAQHSKQKLQNIQRNDAKLRKKHEQSLAKQQSDRKKLQQKQRKIQKQLQKQQKKKKAAE